VIVPNSESAMQVRERIRFPSAREAFASFLDSTRSSRRNVVLLPSYIGWSAREGSGVFDPVRASGLPYRFYPMTRDLRIDVEATLGLLRTEDIQVLVLIHYFGWPDPAAAHLASAARERGIFVLEDEAHALLTDVVGGIAGRDGHAAIYSLHKMLPISDGGMLVWNDATFSSNETTTTDVALDARFDLAAMARQRIMNARQTMSLLEPLAGRVDPLWRELPDGVVPQTFPVIVRTVDRSHLYHQLNASGFGVVSLYHTLISEITEREFPDAHWLAKRVMNLPIHPSVTRDGIAALIGALDRLS
jgi:dTDP-4-amino-4,6-dideoxygalactose transaminase